LNSLDSRAGFPAAGGSELAVTLIFSLTVMGRMATSLIQKELTMDNGIEVHEHLRRRMSERGITLQEVGQTLAAGWPAADAKPGTTGKTLVFRGQYWRGRKVYAEKEVTVYTKEAQGRTIVLTAKARYGQGFTEPHSL